MLSPPPEAGGCTEPAEAALGLVGLNTRPPSPPTGKGQCSVWQVAGQLAGGRDLRTSLQLHERSKATFLESLSITPKSHSQTNFKLLDFGDVRIKITMKTLTDVVSKRYNHTELIIIII